MFNSKDKLPVEDPIDIFYFLIVIGYSSGFHAEEILPGDNPINACPATDGFFILCSLPAWRLPAGSILFSLFNSKDKLQGEVPINVFYFLIVIGYSSVFHAEGILPGCRTD